MTAKIDPKLLKLVNQGKLIAAAKLMEIKNAEKIGKETLVKAFLEKVEKLSEEEQEQLDDVVKDFYNDTVKDLKLVTVEGEEGEPTPTTPSPRGTSQKKGGKATPAKKEKLEKKFTRTASIVQALKKKKSGTAGDYGTLADEIYVQGGGKTGKDASIWLVRTLFEALLLVGYIKKDGNTYSLVK